MDYTVVKCSWVRGNMTVSLLDFKMRQICFENIQVLLLDFGNLNLFDLGVQYFSNMRLLLDFKIQHICFFFFF